MPKHDHLQCSSCISWIQAFSDRSNCNLPAYLAFVDKRNHRSLARCWILSRSLLFLLISIVDFTTWYCDELGAQRCKRLCFCSNVFSFRSTLKHQDIWKQIVSVHAPLKLYTDEICNSVHLQSTNTNACMPYSCSWTAIAPLWEASSSHSSKLVLHNTVN